MRSELTMVKNAFAVGLAALLLTSNATAQDKDEWDVSYDAASPAKRAVIWTLAGAAVVSWGVATGFWIDSVNKAGDVDDQARPRPGGFCRPAETRAACLAALAQHDELVAAQDDAAKRAQYFLAGGTGALVVALGVVLLWPGSTTPTVAPVRSGAVLGVSHAF